MRHLLLTAFLALFSPALLAQGTPPQVQMFTVLEQYEGTESITNIWCAITIFRDRDGKIAGAIINSENKQQFFKFSESVVRQSNYYLRDEKVNDLEIKKSIEAVTIKINKNKIEHFIYTKTSFAEGQLKERKKCNLENPQMLDFRVPLN